MVRFQSKAMKYEIKPKKLRKSRANEESIEPRSQALEAFVIPDQNRSVNGSYAGEVC
jgi:hypothetical protein